MKSEKDYIMGLREGDFILSKNKPKNFSSLKNNNRFFVIVEDLKSKKDKKYVDVSGIRHEVYGPSIISFPLHLLKDNFHIGRYLLTEKWLKTSPRANLF